MHQEKTFPAQVLRSSINSRYRCMRSPSRCSQPLESGFLVAAYACRRTRAGVREKNLRSPEAIARRRAIAPMVPKVLRPRASGLRDLEEMLRSQTARRFELGAVSHHGLRPSLLRFDHPAEKLVLLR